MDDGLGSPSVIRALVVEDNEDARELVRLLLESEGYLVECAENGREALELIRRAPPSFILLDLMMPIMSGWELLDVLRADRALCAIPVGILSAAHDVGDAVRGLPYLAKPVRPDALLAMAAELATAQRPFAVAV